MLAFAGGTYLAFVIQGHRLATQFDAKLAWFQKPFWIGMLFFSRVLKWEKYDSSLQGRLVVDHRGEAVTDEHLRALENFSKCEVLDLEGTEITDASLRHLKDCKNLRCLVVRKTSVTHAGVQRLQQSKRRMWIWY